MSKWKIKSNILTLIEHPMIADLSGVLALVMVLLTLICLMNFMFLTAAATLLASAACAQLDLKSNEGGLISYFLTRR